MKILLSLLAMVCFALPAADLEPAYQAWNQGRPAEAVPVLQAAASQTDSWVLWYDTGLAAIAAGQQEQGLQYLLLAHQKQPLAMQPVTALRVAGVPLPQTWAETLGVIALPGVGWFGLLVVVGGGFLLGLGLRTHRLAWLCRIAGAVLWLAAAPGIVGRFLSEADQFLMTTKETTLVDSTGTPVEAGYVPAGSLLRRQPVAAWGDRLLVELVGVEQRGWIDPAAAGAYSDS